MTLSTVKNRIKTHEMLSPGQTVLLAVSGGIDSMAMLSIFLKIKDEYSLTLVVCHLNHNLRGAESERDYKFVEEAAASAGLLFEGKELTEGELSSESGYGSIQARARKARYEFFEEALERCGADVTALAHNSDDQAETVLMRFIAGTGLKGLRGMEPKRGVYIRPLIDLSRADIMEYAKAEKVSFVEDSSNSTEKYQRNKIRNSLIPLLAEEYNPSIKDALLRSAAQAGEDYGFIEGEARALFEDAVVASSEKKVIMSRLALASAPRALATRAFLCAVEVLKGDSRSILAAHIEFFFDILTGPRPSGVAMLPCGIIVTRRYNEIVVARGLFKGAEPLSQELAVPGRVELSDTGLTLSADILDKVPAELSTAGASSAFFDMDALNAPLLIRGFKEGDRMGLFGMEGTKKLKDIFIDAKIPREDRVGVPIVVSGEEIVWAVGLRRSNVGKIGRETNRVVRLSVENSSGDSDG